jgi:hypothetical protein
MLQTLLEDALEDDGKLSGKTFPILGQLRAQVRSVKADILQTLNALVSMPSIKSKLALEGGNYSRTVEYQLHHYFSGQSQI